MTGSADVAPSQSPQLPFGDPDSLKRLAVLNETQEKHLQCPPLCFVKPCRSPLFKIKVKNPKCGRRLGAQKIRISVYMISIRITCSASPLLCVCVYVHTHTYIHIYVYEHGFILRKNIYLERHMSTLKTHSLTPQTFESPCDSLRFQ